MPPEITPMGRDTPFDPKTEECHLPFTPEGMCKHFELFPNITFSVNGKESTTWSFGFCKFMGDCPDQKDCPSVPKLGGTIQDLVTLRYNLKYLQQAVRTLVKSAVSLS